jgi:BESS motif
MTRYLKTCRAGGNIPRKYYLADHMQFMIPFLKLKEDNCLRTYVDANDTEDNNITMKIVDVKTDLESTYSEKIHLDSTTDDEEKHEVYEIETLDDVIENETDDLIDTSHTEEQQEQDHRQQQHEQQQQQDQQSIAMREYDLDQLPQFTNSQVQSPPMKKFKITEVSLPPPVVVPTTPPLQATCAQNDADMNFLKSLIPDLQLMSAPQKRKFKVTVLSLIDELLSASTMEKS